MKLQLVIDREESDTKHFPRVTVNLLPADDVLSFVYSVATSFEEKAFGLYEEIEQSIKDGDIDTVAKLAPKAKRANDLYLDIHRAAEQMALDLHKAEKGEV